MSSIQRRLAALALAALGTLALAAPAGAASSDLNPYIVVLKDSVAKPGQIAEGQVEARDGELGFVYRHALKGYSAMLPPSAVAALESNPKVAYVSVDRKVGLAEEEVEVPAEEGEEEGEESGPEQAVPTGIDRIFATSNENLDIDEVDDVRIDADVAVLDTGIDFEHPDLDVEGRTNCVLIGISKCADGSGVDGHYHGTHVAGTVGAIDNDFGVVGVAPGARLWAVKVLNNDGVGLESWVVAGVDWVTAHASEIEVANMSLACACSMPTLSTAITNSVKAGVVYAVAAGNSFTNVSGFAPANHTDVIAVSALADYNGKPGHLASPTCANNGGDDTFATFSNYGAGIDIIAPGVCILSTMPNERYYSLSGTSMAAPHVAGAAAIIASSFNPSSKSDVESIRQTLIDNGNAGWVDPFDGIKEPLLDVGSEVQFPGHPPAAVTGEASGVGAKEATVHGSVDPEGLPTTYQISYWGSGNPYAKYTTTQQSAGSGSSPVEVEQGLSSLLLSETYTYRVVATNARGTTYGEEEAFETLSTDASFEIINGTIGGQCTEATLEGAEVQEGCLIEDVEGGFNIYSGPWSNPTLALVCSTDMDLVLDSSGDMYAVDQEVSCGGYPRQACTKGGVRQPWTAQFYGLGEEEFGVDMNICLESPYAPGAGTTQLTTFDVDRSESWSLASMTQVGGYSSPYGGLAYAEFTNEGDEVEFFQTE